MRTRAKLTQQALAVAVGVSSSSVVSRWESDGADPTTANVLAIARACKASPTYILTGDAEDGAAQYEAAWAEFLAGLEAHNMRLTDEELAWLRSMKLPDDRQPSPQWFLASLHSLRMLPRRQQAGEQ